MYNALSDDSEDVDENKNNENMYYKHKFGTRGLSKNIETNLDPSSITCEPFLNSVANIKMYDKRVKFVEHLQKNNKLFQKLVKAFETYENKTSEDQAMDENDSDSSKNTHDPKENFLLYFYLADKPETLATTINIRDRQQLQSICQLLLENKSMCIYVSLTSVLPLCKAEIAEELNLVGEQIDFDK